MWFILSIGLTFGVMTKIILTSNNKNAITLLIFTFLLKLFGSIERQAENGYYARFSSNKPQFFFYIYT